MGSGPVLDLLLGIPLIGIKGTPPVGTGNGSVDSSFILLESSAPTARIALSGEIRPDNAGGRFTAIGMSAESAGIRTAIGIDNGALELELLIKDLAMNATGPGSDLSIDLVNLVGGGSSGSILETLLSILPEGSPLVDDILPMLGIIDSDWHSSSEPNPQWPTIDILDLISNISDMNHVKTM